MAELQIAKGEGIDPPPMVINADHAPNSDEDQGDGGHCSECWCKSCDVAKYCKIGMWNNENINFSLFRCKLSDETRRWYISIVPKNIQPGTNKDVDFYSTLCECCKRSP